MSILANLRDANRRASRRLARHLPVARNSLFAAYERRVVAEIVRRPGAVVVDVGGGRRVSFARPTTPHLTALDISAEELAQNTAADWHVVADACEPLPFPASSVDLVVSHTVLEHLPDVGAFLRESRRILRPNGVGVHFFPSKWAPFSVLNRLLPHGIKRRILFTLRPHVQGVAGFPAYYDRCSASPMSRLAREAGFAQIEVIAGYHAASYVEWLTPLYALHSAYDTLLARFDVEPLAAYLLIIAHPTAPHQSALQADDFLATRAAFA